MVARAVVIFRVGASVNRVGQLLLCVALSACASPATPPVASVSPELVIPRLGGDAGGAPGAGDGAHFAHSPAAVGATFLVELRATSHAPDQVAQYDSVYRVEVLAVDDAAPSRLKVRFLRNVHTYDGTPAPTAIDGNEYIVDGRSPWVHTLTGTAAPEPEAESVLDIFPDVGVRTPIDQVLPDEALPIGARRDDLAAAILHVMHPRSWKLDGGTATLLRVDGEHAVFAVAIHAVSVGLAALHLHVTGEARVRLRDARLSELMLSGHYDEGGASKDAPPSVFELKRTITSEQEGRSAR